MNRVKLSVNIDQVAALRQTRGTVYPEPVQAAAMVELAGADGVGIHLSEDRVHSQDRDVYLVNHTLQTGLTLKIGLNEELVNFVAEVCPAVVCLVAETPDESTDGGGLNVVRFRDRVSDVVEVLTEAGCKVSIQVDPDQGQIQAVHEVGADIVELNTGLYVESLDDEERKAELERLAEAVTFARGLELVVHAGDGLSYGNVEAVAAIEGIDELHVGHAIIARALFSGLETAIRDMRALIDKASA